MHNRFLHASRTKWSERGERLEGKLTLPMHIRCSKYAAQRMTCGWSSLGVLEIKLQVRFLMITQ